MVHAEGNESETPTRMLQLWFEPNRFGGEPVYFSRALGSTGRQLVAGDEGMPLRADVRVWWVTVRSGASEELVVERERQGYLLALTGPIDVDAGQGRAGVRLQSGDGAVVEPGAIHVSTAEGEHAAIWIDCPLS